MKLLLLLFLFFPLFADGQEYPANLSACKELNFCSFQGKCFNLGPGSDYFCMCETGFTGNDCSQAEKSSGIAFSSCQERVCQNGGVCFKKSDSHAEWCLCPAGFLGSSCSEKGGQVSSSAVTAHQISVTSQLVTRFLALHMVVAVMRGLVVFLLAITLSQQHSGFDNLRSSLLSLIIEETSGSNDYEQLLEHRDLWIKVSKIAMNLSFTKETKENGISELVLTEGGDKTKISQMIERLEDIQEKCRIYGVTGPEVVMSALLTGFSERFKDATNENRTKMIEKIIINAEPTKEEREARYLEDMLVDASMTPNYISKMNERESVRLDFLFEVVRIASDPNKSKAEKEFAIVIQFNRTRFYRRLLEQVKSFNVSDFAERLIPQFVWIQIAVKKEEFGKMTREEKMKVIVSAIQTNIKSI